MVDIVETMLRRYLPFKNLWLFFVRRKVYTMKISIVTLVLLVSVSFGLGEQNPNITGDVTHRSNSENSGATTPTESDHHWETPTQFALFMADQFYEMLTKRHTDSRVIHRCQIASALIVVGDDRLALAILEQALRVANQGDFRAPYLNRIASVLAKAGEKAYAKTILNQALGATHQLKGSNVPKNLNKIGISRLKLDLLLKIASTWIEVGDQEQAWKILKHAREEAFKEDHTSNKVSMLHLIAVAQDELGDKPQSLATFMQALELAQHIDFAPRRWRSLKDLAIDLAQAGHHHQANNTLKLVLEEARKISDVRDQGDLLLSVASALVETGNKEHALKTLAEARELFQKHHEKLNISQQFQKTHRNSLSELADAFAMSGDIPQAIFYHKRV